MDLLTIALIKKYVQSALEGAGALEGKDGLSAYEVAKKNGFTGSETDWLNSLKGADGKTPYIGETGNWFIGDVDTNIPGRAPTNISELANDSQYVSQTQLKTINGQDLIGEGDITITISDENIIPLEQIQTLF